MCDLGIIDITHIDKYVIKFAQNLNFCAKMIGCKCYDIKPVRKEEGKSYWKIPLCDDDATREK